MHNISNIDSYGGSNVFSWSHGHLYTVLTSGSNPIVRNALLKKALKKVQRDDFVHDAHSGIAFQDTEVHIHKGETLTKPTVVAQMLELLHLKEGGRYLDIGTGSGWLASLIGEAIGPKGTCYTIERIESIARSAALNLKKYPELNNVVVIHRDGSNGLPEYAPYDGIHLSIAFKEVPEILKKQLKLGGKLVIPRVNNQLHQIIRISEDEYRETVHEGYFFDEMKEGVEK
mgnify:CR=1 FL=1